MKHIKHNVLAIVGARRSPLRALLSASAALVLTACAGGGSGADTQANPNTGAPTVSNYSGPAPATADVP